MPSVILSGFADEAANQKTAVQQFAAFAAVGLKHYSLRFIDAGQGIKNVMKLTPPEVETVVAMQKEYGLSVSSIGSPIGKLKLTDTDDGTHNTYIPFPKYLAEDVPRVCELAHAFGAKLIRGFSFYHPKGTSPEGHVKEVVDRLGKIAEVCGKAGLVFGLEIEANLVGQTGQLLAEIHRQVNHKSMVLIFDAANILCQGFSTAEVYEQYLAMKLGLGWVHIKDYRHPQPVAGRVAHVDEENVWNFVPSDQGDCGHERILRDLAGFIPELSKRLAPLGVPGVYLDLEPHVKSGGQFGGFSGPDGLGVALRALCKVLDYVGIDYHLRDFADIVASRGR